MAEGPWPCPKGLQPPPPPGLVKKVSFPSDARGSNFFHKWSRHFILGKFSHIDGGAVPPGGDQRMPDANIIIVRHHHPLLLLLLPLFFHSS